MHKKSTIFLALVVLLLFQASLKWIILAPTLEDRIVGPDSFMHLHRVLEWRESGDWFQNLDPHINAPYGHALHWTRPFDMMLYAGAWVFSAFTDFRTGLLLSGLFISPLLMIGTVLIWSWATKPFLDEHGYFISVNLLNFMPFAVVYDHLGRADHHSLLFLLFTAQLGIFIRFVLGRASWRQIAVAGALCGLSFWVSVETLTHMLVFCTIMGLFWLWRGGKEARDLALFLGAMVGVATIALLVERPPAHWVDPQFDRISIVHWTLLFSGAVSWTLIFAFDRSTGYSLDRRWRIAAGAIGCAIPGLAMLALFPAFFAGPFAAVKGAALKDYLANIMEFTPLWPTNQQELSRFVLILGPVFLAIAHIAIRWRDIGKDQRLLTALWAAGFAVFLPLAVFQALRWSPYVLLVAWLPWTFAVMDMVRNAWTWRMVAAARFARPAVLALLIASPITVSLMLYTKPTIAHPTKSPCNWRAAARFIAQDKKAIVMTHLFLGPELAWHAGLHVVGAPYNIPQVFEETMHFFAARDDKTPRAILARRGVSDVLVCGIDREADQYKDMPDDILFHRLIRGQAPSWLTPVKLPAGLGEFHLYRVHRP